MKKIIKLIIKLTLKYVFRLCAVIYPYVIFLKITDSKDEITISYNSENIYLNAEDVITFFGTDTHHDEDYSFLENAKLVMKKYIDDKEIKKLLEDNAKELLLHSVK